MKRTELAITLILALIFSFAAGVPVIEEAKANPLTNAPSPPATIYIRSDGIVDPVNASINRVGNVYILTENLTNQCIIIECDNVILDGAGFMLQHQSNVYTGVSLTNRTNITIKNLKIIAFNTGIQVKNSSQIAVRNNNFITRTGEGIEVQFSSNVSLTSNRFANIHKSIKLIYSNGNTITHNTVFYVEPGNNARYFLELWCSTNNTITGNNVINCSSASFVFGNSSNNLIYHNNLVNRIIDKYFDPNIQEAFYIVPSVNIWNSGEGGNYWSGYTGTDNDGDGIGDTPYIINDYNQDNYPLMNPVDITTIPEFPSWIILPLLLIATLLIIICKQKLPKTPSN